MKILLSLSYYRPYTSGLTIYVERLARSLSTLGCEVCILTMKHEESLAPEEIINGIRVVRANPLLKISKGIISPHFFTLGNRLLKKYEILHVHLPQFEAGLLTLQARLKSVPVVISYHCDLNLPPSLFYRIVNSGIHIMNHCAGILASSVVTYTEDYGSHSPFLRAYKKKLAVIAPPVELPEVTEAHIAEFRKKIISGADGPILGMATRLATEKGVEILLQALPRILERFPNAKVAFAGQYQGVLGEEKYAKKLLPQIETYERSNNWQFLGNLSPMQMACFYPCLDILVVPSLNATESFGLVQVEAMFNKVPAVASNLPGVRQPVTMTGMGAISEIGDVEDFTKKVTTVLENRREYQTAKDGILEMFAPTKNAEQYIELYRNITA